MNYDIIHRKYYEGIVDASGLKVGDSVYFADIDKAKIIKGKIREFDLPGYDETCILVDIVYDIDPTLPEMSFLQPYKKTGLEYISKDPEVVKKHLISCIQYRLKSRRSEAYELKKKLKELSNG